MQSSSSQDDGCAGQGPRMTSQTSPRLVTQMAGVSAGHYGKKSDLKLKSHRAGDPLFQLLLGRCADLARGELALLEQHQGRDRLDAVFRGRRRVLVDVELDDLDLAGHRAGNFL